MALAPTYNDFTTLYPNPGRQTCFNMARAPPNNHFAPILADRFGGFKMAIAPPNNDFTTLYPNPGRQVWRLQNDKSTSQQPLYPNLG